jgi:alpha-tubulin suppressor-like RCC1 family protein
VFFFLLLQVPALKNRDIAKVAAGTFHSLALSMSGMELYSFGRADYGQLGLGFAVTNVAGSNKDTPQRVPFPCPDRQPQRIVKIITSEHTCAAITHNKHFYVWGFNATGQTGIKNNGKDVVRPTKLPLSMGEGEDMVGSLHACMGPQQSLVLVKPYMIAKKTGKGEEMDETE